jgi:serine/threonine protein kinase
MLIMENRDNLSSNLSNNFHNITWKDKIKCLYDLIYIIRNAHKLGKIFKDINSEDILYRKNNNKYYISHLYIPPSRRSKFFYAELSESEDDKTIYGVLPYIAPEILCGKSYTPSSDIYSFGIIMAELSSGNPPFHDRKHDELLALDIVCNGLRPECGRGTPDIYKKLVYKCMDANSNERPKANELYHFINDWNNICNGKDLGNKRNKIKAIFDEADKQIPNISLLYANNSHTKHITRRFTFNYYSSKPVNKGIYLFYFYFFCK